MSSKISQVRKPPQFELITTPQKLSQFELITTPRELFQREIKLIIQKVNWILIQIEKKETKTGLEGKTIPHSMRVSELAEQAAFILKNNNKFLNISPELIKFCGIAHDIGKLSMSQKIIHSHEKINQETFEHKIKPHPSFGNLFLNIILLNTSIDRTSPFFLALSDAILFHHQKLDGSGYPNLNQKDDFLLSTQIISIADAFDAKLTRPYTENESFNKKFNDLSNELLAAPNKYNSDIVNAVAESALLMKKDLYQSFFPEETERSYA